MNLKVQKTIAAKVMKVSPKKVKFSDDAKDQIKESITRQDIKELIEKGHITKLQDKGVSRVRANYIKRQKAKGKRKGKGSRKGKATARLKPKDAWVSKVRTLRKYLADLNLRNRIKSDSRRSIYRKIGGGFFRSKSHVNLFLTENNLWNDKE